jgi:cell division protein FtsN
VPKNEDGEFELILGNKQLLSVFFIVIVLFAILFVMGYILGRNSGPLAPETASVRKTEKPLVVESPGRDANPAPPILRTEPTPQPVAPQAPPEKEQPVETAKPEPAKPERAKPEPAKTKAEKRAEKAAEKAAKAEKSAPKFPPASPSSSGPSGTYLQLAATTQHEASLLVEVLQKKGFKSMVAEVPEKPGLWRVLVGPLSDGSANKTKADLQASGFPGDKAIKRTF